MKRFTTAAAYAVLTVLAAGDLQAQQDPQSAVPLKGANSFTEGQARDRVLAAGITDVSPLTKDGDGIWRGTGRKDDREVAVAVDFKGNVISH